MTGIEEHEMNEAAMSLVMFSEQVYDFSLPPGYDKSIKEKILDCVESIIDFRELFSHSGFEKSSTCSDVVVQALPSPLRAKLTQSNSSYECKKYGKIFGCYQALGGHQRLHRSIKGHLACKKDDISLSDSLEAKEIVSQPLNFEVSQEKKILDCVESKQDFSELLALKSKLKIRPESSSSYKCNICGKSYGCFQALGGHKRLHSSIKVKLPHTEDDTSLSDSVDAMKIVSQQSNFEVSQDGKIINCIESKQDFSELLSRSGFGKFSSCSKTSFSSLPSTQSKSSYDCKICGNMFRCSQALGSHQRTHKPVREQLAHKRKYTEGYKSLSDSLEAKKIFSIPSSFEVSEEEKMLHCVESKQDFTELFSHSGFDKSSSCSNTRFSPLPSPLRSKSQSSYKCKLRGKSFVCSEALLGHKIHMSSIKQKLVRKKKVTEDGNSLFGLTDSEAIKFVSQPSSFEISQEKKILHCVESKQDFSELFSH